jgi:hypothetical protein
MVASISDHHRLVSMHRPLGILILILVVIRFVNRRFSTLPPFPASMSSQERFVASASEILLYALLFVQPLVGWGMVRYGRIINLLSLRALRSSGISPHATPEDFCGPGISESHVTCETSIAFPKSSRRNDTSVQLTVTRRNRVRRNSLRRKHQFQQPLARLPRKAFGTTDANTCAGFRIGRQT